MSSPATQWERHEATLGNQISQVTRRDCLTDFGHTLLSS